MRRLGLLSGARPGGGFSLIEVLAALTIFSVAVVALLSGLGTSLALQNDLVASERAAMLAENVLEEMKLEGAPKVGQDSGAFKDDDAGFAWSTEVEETQTTDLRQVTVTVTWNTGRGEKNYRLVTLLLDQGGADSGSGDGAGGAAGGNLTGSGGGSTAASADSFISHGNKQ